MKHASHPDIAARLKRAEGHIRSVIAMIEDGRPCLELTQQLHAVERAVGSAKRELIHDHIDNCLEHALDDGPRAAQRALTEIKSITKYL